MITLNRDPKTLKLILDSIECKYNTWKKELEESGKSLDKVQTHKIYSRYQQERHKVLSDWGIIPVDENI